MVVGADDGPAFGVLLRRHRTAARLTQEELAERAGLSSRALRAIEQGRTGSPYRNSVARLAEALELSGDELAEFVRASRAGWAASPRGLTSARSVWAAAAAGTAASEWQVLLSTKLYLPRPPAGLVARPRLAEALADGRAGALVLVSAPAGFGKTASLADWVRGRSGPAGWLSLDAGDNDPARFWRHVAAALDRVCPGISDRVGPMLGPPPPASFEGPVTALINELAEAAGDEEVLLVLDDYHVI